MTYYLTFNPRRPHTDIACLINHPTLFQGEVVRPTYGYWYEGIDERGLPTHFCGENDDGIIRKEEIQQNKQPILCTVTTAYQQTPSKRQES